MNLKNLDLFNDGTIVIFTHVNHKMFVVEFDKSSFDFFRDIDLYLEHMVVFKSQDAHIFTSYESNRENNFNAIMLINRAFDRNLRVLDILANEVTKDDFKKYLESEGITISVG